jgi:hypothetical protein
LCGIKRKKSTGNQHGYTQNNLQRQSPNHNLGFKNLPKHIFISHKHFGHRGVSGGRHPFDTALGFRGVEVEDNKLSGHGHEGKYIQHAHHGHYPMDVNKVSGDRRKKYCQKPAYIYPVKNRPYFTLFGIVHPQAFPGDSGDLPKAVDYSPCQKPPKILGKSPYQSRNTPGNDIENQSRHAPAVFIRYHTGNEGHHHLDEPPGRQYYPNLNIQYPQVIHIQCHKRHE